MFSSFISKSKNKDNKKSDGRKVSSSSACGGTTRTIIHQETHHTTITQQRSYSVSSTESPSYLHESISLPTLQSRSNLSSLLMSSNSGLFGAPSSSKRSALGSLPTQIDAKPSTSSPINLNYSSPYRSSSSSPLYRSYNNKISSSAPSVIKRPAPPVVRVTPSSSVSSPRPSEPLINFNRNKSNKLLTVKKTGERYDTKFNPTVPTYKTSLTKIRGHVLIINNIMFNDNKSYRAGAEFDDKNLHELFAQMNFKVKVKRNLKAKEIEDSVKKFSHNSDLKSGSISMVIVMSHGTNRRTLGGYTEIIGVDEMGLPTDKILDCFNTKNCPQMALKPKIFIFQCCRGDNEDFTHHDVVRIDKNLSNFGDMLVAFSSLPGFVSHRDPNKGTWYIQTLCEVFSEHSHHHDVEEMLKIVDSKLSRSDIVQTSSYENRGFKKCYLHP